MQGSPGPAFFSFERFGGALGLMGRWALVAGFVVVWGDVLGPGGLLWVGEGEVCDETFFGGL